MRLALPEVYTRIGLLDSATIPREGVFDPTEHPLVNLLEPPLLVLHRRPASASPAMAARRSEVRPLPPRDATLKGWPIGQLIHAPCRCMLGIPMAWGRLRDTSFSLQFETIFLIGFCGR